MEYIQICSHLKKEITFLLSHFLIWSMDLLLFKIENVVLWDIKLLNQGPYMKAKQALL